MELDHIFIFTDIPEQVASSLTQFGLTEGTPNTHPGQGTSCRRFFFHNAYFELLWVSNEEEIKNPSTAQMKLWERSQFTKTGYCPIGLCFRNAGQSNNNTALIFDDGWQYKPSYLPEGLYINIASNINFPQEPLLFEFYRVATKDSPGQKLQPINHKKGFQEITKVNLMLPSDTDHLSGAMKKVISNSIVRVTEGENYSLALEFDDGKYGKTEHFNNVIPFSILW